MAPIAVLLNSRQGNVSLYDGTALVAYDDTQAHKYVMPKAVSQWRNPIWTPALMTGGALDVAFSKDIFMIEEAAVATCFRPSLVEARQAVADLGPSKLPGYAGSGGLHCYFTADGKIII